MRIPDRLRTRPRLRVALAGAAASVLCGTGAFAYWAAPGSGAAGGTVTTALPVTISPAIPATRVAPGLPAALAATISNPNPFPVRVNSLARDTGLGTAGFAVDPGHAACGVASLSYATQNNGGNGWTVSPRVGGVDGTLAVNLPDALVMATSAAATCQGATFTVYLTVS